MKNIFTTVLSLAMLFMSASTFGQSMDVENFNAVSVSSSVEATLVQSTGSPEPDLGQALQAHVEPLHNKHFKRNVSVFKRTKREQVIKRHTLAKQWEQVLAWRRKP